MTKFIYFLVSVSLSHSVQAQGQTSDLHNIKDKWTHKLQGFFAKDPRAVIIDLDLTKGIPNDLVYNPSFPSISYSTLGATTGNKWFLQDEALIFTQNRDIYGRLTRDASIASWLSTLGEPDSQALMNEGLSLSSIDDRGVQLLLQLATEVTPGLESAMLTSPDVTSIQVKFMPMIRGVREADSSTFFRTLPTKYSADGLANPNARIIRRAQPANMAKPADGELDFGEGAICTLSELQVLVGKKKAPFSFDRRLGTSTYFVKGKFGPDAFLKDLTLASNVPSISSATSLKPDIRTRVEGVLNGPWHPATGQDVLVNPTSKYSPDDFLKCRSGTASELLGGDPYWSKFMDVCRLGPSDSITLEPGIAIVINCGNSRYDPSFATTVEGKPFPARVRNRIVYIVSR